MKNLTFSSTMDYDEIGGVFAPVLDKLIEQHNNRKDVYTVNIRTENKLFNIRDYNTLDSLAREINPGVPFRKLSFTVSPSLIFYDDGNILCFTQNITEQKKSNLSAWGSKEFTEKVNSYKRKKLDHRVDLKWDYKAANGINDQHFYIERANEAKDEFYPFLNDTVDNFIDRYLNSAAPILMLIGPPGTGKTSFIRHLLYTKKLPTQVTFDENVMIDDTYYINYMSQDTYKLLVIEDADVALASRQTDENKLMSKFLNISDGLVPLLEKKIIFSTNLDNIQRIDSALLRPGRCFDVICFRPLTYKEACRVCDAAGIDRIEDDGKEYTLSEILNSQQNKEVGKRRTGFF